MAKRHGMSAPLREEEKRNVNATNVKHLAGIFRYMLPYKGLFILGLVSLALSSFTILSFPRLSGELLDVASGKPKYFSTINEVALALIRFRSSVSAEWQTSELPSIQRSSGCR
jgi:ATP-binding cassette, subfamily B, bacterial